MSTTARPTDRAMKAAVEMEMHATVGTRTIDKGAMLDKHFPAYDELLEAMKGIEHFRDALDYRDDHLSKALRQWIEAGRAAIAKIEATQ